jgi:purine-binding chemotaxis protein CheW
MSVIARDIASAVEAAGDTGQYLTFQLAGETFAIGILAIKEILEYVPLTRVPLMPPFIRGVMNLRGAVVPVIDLARRFGRAATQIGRRTGIVIIEVTYEEQQLYIGVLVDAVHEVLAIPAADIEPPPQFGGKIRADFITGMAKVGARFVVLLHVEHVLSVEEMTQLTDLQADAAPDLRLETD